MIFLEKMFLNRNISNTEEIIEKFKLKIVDLPTLFGRKLDKIYEKPPNLACSVHAFPRDFSSRNL